MSGVARKLQLKENQFTPDKESFRKKPSQAALLQTTQELGYVFLGAFL